MFKRFAWSIEWEEPSSDTSEKKVFPWTLTCSVTNFLLLFNKKVEIILQIGPLEMGHVPAFTIVQATQNQIHSKIHSSACC